jgi:hypothetical protein
MLRCPWLAALVVHAAVVAAGSRPRAGDGGGGGPPAKKGLRVPQRQHKFVVNLPPESQIMIYSEPMTGPGSMPICLIPGGEILRVVTVGTKFIAYCVLRISTPPPVP